MALRTFLPPTSAPQTDEACSTSLTRQLRECSILSPPSISQSCAIVVRGPSCHCEGDTVVELKAKCVTSKTVNPLTKFSNRLASKGLPPSMSRFLTMTFVDTRPPPSLQPAHLPPAQLPWIPRHPRTLLDGGHDSRGDGHIGNCGRTTLGTAAGRCVSTRRWRMPTLLARGPFCDLHNTRSGLVKMGEAILATRSSWQARGRFLPSATGLSSSSFCPERNECASRVRTFPCEEAHHRFCVSFHAQDAVSPTGLLPNTIQQPYSSLRSLQRCPPTSRKRPRTLKIPHCGDLLQRTGLFGCRGVQESEDSLRRSKMLTSSKLGASTN